MPVSLRFGLVLCAGLASACASDRYVTESAHRDFDRRDYATAAENYGKAASEAGANQVLFLLDQATSRFAAREYDKALPLFLRAEDLMAIKDYTSVSEEIGTLATGEGIRGYKGEDFEKILVNVYLALGFASLDKLEDAQVEARKINQLLYRMITEGKRNYQESPFARYLSAMLWEATGETNSAYIDYKKAYELDPGFPDLGSDLLATSKRMGFDDEFARWREAFPQSSPRAIPKDSGEVVVFFEKGRGPLKVPRYDDDASLPRYVSRYSDEMAAQVLVNGVATANASDVLDVTRLSKSFLEDRIGRLRAARLAGAAVKGAIAYGVGKASGSDDLGWLTFFLLLFSDRADLRSWRTLPSSIQMARFPLPAGRYDLAVDVAGIDGRPMRRIDLGRIDLKAGRKVFRTAR